MRFDLRKLTFLLLAMLLIPAIAACGGGDDGDDDEVTPNASPGTTVTATTNAQQTSTADASPEGTPDQSGVQTPPAVGSPSATAAPQETSEVDHRDEPFAFGWNVAWRGDDTGAEFNDQTIGLVQESGFGWVRFMIEWSYLERADDQWDPLPFDRVIDQYNAAGLNVLVVVAKAPEWALDPEGRRLLADFTEFQEAMHFLADRYRGKVQAWEIWNEQNLAREMDGNVRPRDYVDLLRAGATGVRGGNPEALIVFGGLTPNGVNDPSIAIDDVQYLELIYNMAGDEIGEFFDIMGVHVSSTHNPPDTMWPDNPGPEGWNDHPSFYFRRAEQLRAVMLANGDDAKPIWITEFGWTTENQAAGYEYGADNTEEEVAEYLTGALEIATTEWDFCTGAFVWNLNWSTLAAPEAEIYPWSAVNADWSPRPAFEAMKAFPKE